jgi:hypothetical protein
MFKQEQRGVMAGGFKNQETETFVSEEKRMEQMGFEGKKEQLQTAQQPQTNILTNPDYVSIAKAIHDELDDTFIDEDLILTELQKLGNNEVYIESLKEAYRMLYGTSIEAELRDRYEDEEVLKKFISELTPTGTAVINASQGKVFRTDQQYKKATNFQEIVLLFKAAEDLLIENGYTDIDERIKILRGIYYGTTWSMDYIQEKSTTRNAGFDLYTASYSRPADPQAILGKSLFEALRSSPEVKDGNRSVDIGHLIIGLEARTKFVAREIGIPMNGGTGLEIVTWLGDLGGGAGMVAMKRAENASIRSKTIVYNASGNDYGCKINLEGDVAAYVLAMDKSEKDDPSYPDVKEYGYVSDAIANYLLPKYNKISDDWTNRAKLFAEMIGFEFDNNKLTNKDDITEDLADQIFDFADNYALIRLQNNDQLTKDKAAKTSEHTRGASKEVAKIFVDLIEKCVIDPSRQLIAELDPDPSPKGEKEGLLARYAASLQTAEDFIDKLK